MNDNQIQPGIKSLLWIGSAIVFFALALLVLNIYDNSRKYNQFKAMNDSFNQSDYPARLSQLLSSFDTKDTIKIIKLNECIHLIEKDFDNIDAVELYIADTNKYFLLESNLPGEKLNSIEIMDYLPADISKVLHYFESNTNDLKILYKLQDAHRLNTTIIKIGKGYLKLTSYRK
jgi:hypothetical protein